MTNTIKMLGVLFLATFLAAASLAVVNQVTKEPIAKWATVQQAEALQQVMPTADNFKEVVPAQQWAAVKGTQKIGTVFISEIQGYSGFIKLVFAIDLENKITGVKILSHTETPGLGANITKDVFRNQFKGKSVEGLVLKKEDPAQGQIDAITAATISSRAVTLAVKRALQAYLTSQTAGKQGDK